ncbi:MAG TPA: hypothetical protein VHA82_22630 [Ramlibacter sp.]|uniref:hypothetical protein n=1 Tax=Ramlibacter sp. TaxID=1917967 RepID=UPI002CB81506|nr:hypothetical protein [Ramlibacter sp.]HVZ46619.1 hypothetical protein [Ramlibacter sp.]
MNERLRHIALTVEQVTGGYGWLLFESAGKRLVVLERAKQPYRTYLRALQAGYEALALLSACGLHERGIGHEPATREAEAARELVELD